MTGFLFNLVNSLIISQQADQVNAVPFFVLNLVVLLLSLRNQRAQARERAALDQLQKALAEVKILEGLLPICAQCKNIRDDNGYWNQVEIYIRNHSSANYTHSICPDCVKALYPDIYAHKKQNSTEVAAERA